MLRIDGYTTLRVDDIHGYAVIAGDGADKLHCHLERSERKGGVKNLNCTPIIQLNNIYRPIPLRTKSKPKPLAAQGDPSGRIFCARKRLNIKRLSKIPPLSTEETAK